MDISWKYLLRLLILVYNGLECNGKRRISLDLVRMDERRDILIENPEVSTSLEVLITDVLDSDQDNWISLKAGEGYGLMVFIKSAHLRTFGNERNGTECRDYLLFDGDEKVCDEVKGADRRASPPGLFGPRGLMRPSGGMELLIHTDYFPSFPKNKTHVLLATLILTPYTNCSSATLETNETRKGLRRCSREETSSCIHSSLFCDGEVNCLLEGSVGIDEMMCGRLLDNKGLYNHKRPTAPSNPSKETRNGPEYEIRQYFIPTGLFLLVLWGFMSLVWKFYKCYRADYSKDEMFY